VKRVREIGVPDRLWEPLGRLATTLGVEREALVQQALQAFLRFHGALPLDGPAEAPPASPVAAAEPPRRDTARHVLDTARELERAITPGRGVAAAPGRLSLHGERGLLAQVEHERFVIGRGRHCDLVIDSAKVSREHAVIWREVDGWWIEDLGSSNGTWFAQARIDRRRIADGDEYFVCAERLRCVLS
jgi:pSer/pThr/pTyr-binding forkhead associated (FHA) protein